MLLLDWIILKLYDVPKRGGMSLKKEFFVSLMEEILDFEESRQRLQYGIRELAESCPTVTLGDGLISFLLSYINEEIGIKDTELLFNLVLENKDTGIFYNNKLKVKTLEELYDFLVDMH